MLCTEFEQNKLYSQRGNFFQELLGKQRTNRLVKALSAVWRHTFARLGEDWVFLALLGIIMALLSYMMDKGISMCTNGKLLKSI